jgi:pullulanase-type alpha-1,6-glucosidase
MTSLVDTLKSQLRSLTGHLSVNFVTVTLHYHRRKDDYAGWGLHIWGTGVEPTQWEAPLFPSGQDAFGVYWQIKVSADSSTLGYVIHKNNEKDPGPDQSLHIPNGDCEIWLVQGKPTQFSNPEDALAALVITLSPAPRPARNQVVLHYRRTAQDYDNWGLHVWGEANEQVVWTSPLLPTGQDEYGIYWLVNLKPGATTLDYAIHKGDLKDPGPDQHIILASSNREIYLIQGSAETFSDAEIAQDALMIADIGDIRQKAQAHWLQRDLIAWPLCDGENSSFILHYDPTGNIQLTKTGPLGGQGIPLHWRNRQLPPELAIKFPHLQNAHLLQIPEAYCELVPQLLKGQCAISAHYANGNIQAATALQIPGVLDDLYAQAASQETLGIVWKGDIPLLRLWAPTAKSVSLHLFPNSSPEEIGENFPLAYDPLTGIWQIEGEPSWKGKYYLFDVEVFIRQKGAFAHNLITDPYSISLSTNSLRSQIVDLNDTALKPADWDMLRKPALDAPTDIVLYELHVREFSSADSGVPEALRGTYLAFTQFQSYGMQHLQALAQAGLTHIHLLPVADIASINEDKTTWKRVDFAALAQLPPDSEQQQNAVQATRGTDGFNWGYDPFHFTTPEGSYAINPDGAGRILEFRQMVQALSQIELRVVMDVVYNHTYASGQNEKSVLDRTVPGYYHRLDENGYVCNSTCCANTATEHAMMEKLMLDSLKTWATCYKIDGFRFDLMGHHMAANLFRVREMLDELTLQTDGVDGKKIYLYGEGWDFGEVAGGARGRNATQYNLAGSGVGTFDDRLRDATRGGNPFGDMTEQGYLTGMYTDPNESDSWPVLDRLHMLSEMEDEIRVALAGNLAQYRLVNRFGSLVRGDQIYYRGSSSGYAKSPAEHIAYITAHDNETLFDTIQYKAPLRLSTYERARIQKLGISLIVLSQGIPFLDAGIEILRSKSMDRDSYDSGDWFNRLDYSYHHNNWGVGLPLRDKNGHHWPLIQPRLANPRLAPSRDDILATRSHTLEMLRIRKSSPLFRLGTARDIFQRVQFFNVGPGHIPGLIVMALDDSDPLPDLDPTCNLIMVCFNAEDTAITYSCRELRDVTLALHPVLTESADPVVRTATFASATHTFTIPGRTTAVFVGQGHLPPSPMLADYPIRTQKTKES